VQDDVNGDEKVGRFEDLGRKLFQADKEQITEDDPTEEGLDDE
jgi:hypothetical protein